MKVRLIIRAINTVEALFFYLNLESNLSSSSSLADSEARPRIDEEDVEHDDDDVAVDDEKESASATATGRSKLEDSPTRSDFDLLSILAMVGLHDGIRFTLLRPTTAQVRAPVLSSAASEDTDTKSVSVDVRALFALARYFTAVANLENLCFILCQISDCFKIGGTGKD